MASLSLPKLAAFSLASLLGLVVGACGDPGGGNCSPGTQNCVCSIGECLPGLQCVANFCIPGSGGDGDGDTDNPGDGDPGDGDGEATGDGDGDNTGDGDGDPTGDGDGDNTGDGDGDNTGDGDGDGDDPGNGLGEPCDLYAQDCADGLKCDPSTDPAVCSELSPNPDQAGENCDLASGSCDAGNLCMWVGDDDIGVCYPICGGSEDNPVCGGGEFCAQLYPPLCLDLCDPLGNDCGAGRGCFNINVSMEFGCLPVGNGIPLGDPCGFINDCASGLGCHPDTTTCAEYCDVGNPPFNCTCDELFDGIGLCS